MLMDLKDLQKRVPRVELTESFLESLFSEVADNLLGATYVADCLQKITSMVKSFARSPIIRPVKFPRLGQKTVIF